MRSLISVAADGRIPELFDQETGRKRQSPVPYRDDKLAAGPRVGQRDHRQTQRLLNGARFLARDDGDSQSGGDDPVGSIHRRHLDPVDQLLSGCSCSTPLSLLQDAASQDIDVLVVQSLDEGDRVAAGKWVPLGYDDREVIPVIGKEGQISEVHRIPAHADIGSPLFDAPDNLPDFPLFHAHSDVAIHLGEATDIIG